MFCFTGLSNEVDFGVYNNTFNALERAIKERVFFVKQEGKFVPPYRPSAETFSTTMLNFKKQMRKLSCFTTPLEASAFAETCQPRKRKVYLKAALDNLTYGFNDRLSFIRSFVKAEKYNFTAKPDAVPRIIQPRDPRFLVETGRYIKPIEKKIYKNINVIFGDTVVYKGMNQANRGENLYRTWCQFKHPVAIGTDASRFDQHVSHAALLWEHSVYGLFYPQDKHFRRLMSLQRNNRCISYVGDGFVKYKTKHNRMSGDSNTSLGNVLIMCGLMFEFRTFIKINFSLVNDGDDCVIICEREDQIKIQDALPDFFMKCGFTMVTEKSVDIFERIVFCQCQPVMGPEGTYVMVRDPRVSISKDLVALKPLDEGNLAQRWLAAVGEGGMSLTSGMPVLQSFYSCLLRNSNGAKKLIDPTLEGGFFRNSIGMNSKVSPVSDESRLSFWLAFDIAPESQLALEAYYLNMTLTVGELGTRFAILPISHY